MRHSPWIYYKQVIIVAIVRVNNETSSAGHNSQLSKIQKLINQTQNIFQFTIQTMRFIAI